MKDSTNKNIKINIRKIFDITLLSKREIAKKIRKLMTQWDLLINLIFPKPAQFHFLEPLLYQQSKCPLIPKELSNMESLNMLLIFATDLFLRYLAITMSCQRPISVSSFHHHL
jgi:hypothetical protein